MVDAKLNYFCLIGVVEFLFVFEIVCSFFGKNKLNVRYFYFCFYSYGQDGILFDKLFFKKPTILRVLNYSYVYFESNCYSLKLFQKCEINSGYKKLKKKEFLKAKYS